MLKKDGYSSILFLIIAATILPLLLFFIVELKDLYNVKDQIRDATENAASAAAWQLNAEELEDGEIVIDELLAERMAIKTFYKSTGFTEEGEQVGGKLKSLPTIHVDFAYPIGEESVTYEAPEGLDFTIDHPTVIVRTEVDPKGIFFARFFEMKTVVAKTISLPPRKEPTSIIGEGCQNGGSYGTFMLIHVDNPISYPEEDNLFPLDCFNQLDLLAGNDVSFSFVRHMGVTRDGQYTVTFHTSRPIVIKEPLLDNQIVTFKVPSNIPHGTRVSLNVSLIQRGNEREIVRDFSNFGVVIGDIHSSLMINTVIPD